MGRERMVGMGGRFALAAIFLAAALAVSIEDIGPVTIMDIPTPAADKAVSDANKAQNKASDASTNSGEASAKGNEKNAMAKIEAVEAKLKKQASGDNESAGDASKLVLATDTAAKSDLDRETPKVFKVEDTKAPAAPPPVEVAAVEASESDSGAKSLKSVAS